MSIKLMTQVWEREVSGTEQAVLLCLADYANDEGLCWPGVDRIAWKVGASDRTIRRALNALEERGAIEKHRRFGSSTVYTLHLETLPEKRLFSPRSGQNDRIDTGRLNPVTDDRTIRSELCPHDSVIAMTDKPLEDPSERTGSSAAAPQTGAGSPKENAARKAELNRYWAAFKTASGLSALALKQMGGKGRGQIERVLRDPDAAAGVTVEAFAAQTIKTRSRLEARGALQYLSPAEVFADLGRAQSASENAERQAVRIGRLIDVYKEFRWRREKTHVFSGTQERRDQVRADLVSSLTAALADTPDLSPADFLAALEWRWYLEPLGEQTPCLPKDVRWAVQRWVRDGRKLNRSIDALAQRLAEEGRS